LVDYKFFPILRLPAWLRQIFGRQASEVLEKIYS